MLKEGAYDFVPIVTILSFSNSHVIRYRWSGRAPTWGLQMPLEFRPNGFGALTEFLSHFIEQGEGLTVCSPLPMVNPPLSPSHHCGRFFSLICIVRLPKLSSPSSAGLEWRHEFRVARWGRTRGFPALSPASAPALGDSRADGIKCVSLGVGTV